MAPEIQSEGFAMDGYDIVRAATLFGIYFVLYGVVERFFGMRHVEGRVRPALLTDVLHWFFTRFLTGLLAGVFAAGIGMFVADFAFMQPVTGWVGAQVIWVQVPLAMLLIMFIDYWDHRIAHEWPLRWRFHAVHHSSTHLDWLASTRLHPVDQAIHQSLTYTFVFALGFPFEVFATTFFFFSLLAIFVHSNLKVSFGPLDRILVSPKVHHWHHTTNPINKNYGAFSPIMDQIFGTYHNPKGEWPAEYGIHEPIPENYIAHLLSPFGIATGRRRRVKESEPRQPAAAE